ncbi:hypothetical protein [Ralstonia flaminis]|uniref:hypothetical protein n=1 Tax=Ralstonia flaminis TaxID=3058597 RepID=UPI00292CBAF5|nr:hypothetical protein [Ralstonia sp. LMG 18101]
MTISATNVPNFTNTLTAGDRISVTTSGEAVTACALNETKAAHQTATRRDPHLRLILFKPA